SYSSPYIIIVALRRRSALLRSVNKAFSPKACCKSTEGPFQSPQVSPNSEKPCNAKSDCKVFCEVHVFDTTQCHASRLSLEKLFFKRKISEYTGSNERPLSSITFSAYSAALSRSS